MTYRFSLCLAVAIAAALGPQFAPAAVVFRPGQDMEIQAPGEETISGDAAELFKIGQEAEKDGNTGRAIKAYRKLVKRFPRSTLAPGAQWRQAQLLEQTGDYLPAAGAYAALVAQYPRSPNYNEAIDAQFRIGEMYLAGKKLKLLGLPLFTSMDRAVDIFAAIIKGAPYGKWTAKAQFDIGRAREKQGANDAAVQAYAAVVEKFPNSPEAPQAQFQIGYIWMTAAESGTADENASIQSREAFQDFLFRYPNNEKAPQARDNLAKLGQKQTSNAFDIAKYYDKRHSYRAAVVYYNEVIRRDPKSPASEVAKKRVDELRAKFGEAALKPPEQSPAELARAKQRQKAEGEAVAAGLRPPPETVGPERRAPKPPDFRGNPADLAPLPGGVGDSLPPAPGAPSAATDSSATPSPSPGQ